MAATYNFTINAIKQSGQYSEQKPRTLKRACWKLDLWVQNALCFDGVVSAWFHF